MIESKIKPDFLAIGPEKTGTSFLYMLLKDNCRVSLPPRKELRYWNEGNLIPTHSLLSLLTSSHWHYKSLRTHLKMSVRNSLYYRTAPISNLLWDIRYCIGNRSGTWYDSLFERNGTLTGDISPLYYHIPESQIRECSRHNPDMKILIFIREPIDRVWSKARMVLLRHQGRNAADFDLDEFRDLCQKVYSLWVPYIKTIQLWQSYFSQVYIAIYDELLNNPKDWYQKICDFLEIEANNSISLESRINEGIDFHIPTDCERILFKQYGQELKEIGELYDLPNWLEKYQGMTSRFAL